MTDARADFLETTRAHLASAVTLDAWVKARTVDYGPLSLPGIVLEVKPRTVLLGRATRKLVRRR